MNLTIIADVPVTSSLLSNNVSTNVTSPLSSYYENGDVIETHWNGFFIFLAYLTAFTGSYTAIRLLEYGLWRSDKEQENASSLMSKFPVLSSAFCLGYCGIWSMHFVMMHARVLDHIDDDPICYDTGQIMWSLPLAFVGVFMGISITQWKDIFSGEDRVMVLKALLRHNKAVHNKSNRKRASRQIHLVALCSKIHWIVLGSSLAALGALGMNYVSMTALMGPFRIEWSIPWIASSVVIGVLGCFVGFWVLFRPLHWKVENNWYRYGASALLALALCSLQFLAMMAVTHVYKEPTQSAAYCSQSEVQDMSPTTFQVLILALLVPYISSYVEHTISQELRVTYRQLLELQVQIAQIANGSQFSSKFPSKASSMSRGTNSQRSPSPNRVIQVSGLDLSDDNISLASGLSLSSGMVSVGSIQSTAKRKKDQQLQQQHQGGTIIRRSWPFMGKTKAKEKDSTAASTSSIIPTQQTEEGSSTIPEYNPHNDTAGDRESKVLWRSNPEKEEVDIFAEPSESSNGILIQKVGEEEHDQDVEESNQSTNDALRDSLVRSESKNSYHERGRPHVRQSLQSSTHSKESNNNTSFRSIESNPDRAVGPQQETIEPKYNNTSFRSVESNKDMKGAPKSPRKRTSVLQSSAPSDTGEIKEKRKPTRRNRPLSHSSTSAPTLHQRRKSGPGDGEDDKRRTKPQRGRPLSNSSTSAPTLHQRTKSGTGNGEVDKKRAKRHRGRPLGNSSTSAPTLHQRTKSSTGNHGEADKSRTRHKRGRPLNNSSTSAPTLSQIFPRRKDRDRETAEEATPRSTSPKKPKLLRTLSSSSLPKLFRMPLKKQGSTRSAKSSTSLPKLLSPINKFLQQPMKRHSGSHKTAGKNVAKRDSIVAFVPKNTSYSDILVQVSDRVQVGAEPDDGYCSGSPSSDSDSDSYDESSSFDDDDDDDDDADEAIINLQTMENALHRQLQDAMKDMHVTVATGQYASEKADSHSSLSLDDDGSSSSSESFSSSEFDLEFGDLQDLERGILDYNT